MSTAQLFIPSKLRVGFQARSDTYSGRLGFVIYFDPSGELKKKNAWTAWCSRSQPRIDPVDHDNVPTEGFVLNRDVGGARHSYGGYVRNTYARVYDPRGFEVEITIPNLLFILQEGVCHPGKGLDGKFVYAWDNQQLVLLPVKSVDYEQAMAYTALQDQGREVKASDLVVGHTYETKRQEHWVYLGRFDYYYAVHEAPKVLPNGYAQAADVAKKPAKPRRDKGVRKKFIFAKQHETRWRLVYLNEVKHIARVSSTTPLPNFADLVDLHTRTARGSRIVRFVLGPTVDRHNGSVREWVYEVEPGVFAFAETYPYMDGAHTRIHDRALVRDGAMVRLGPVDGYIYPPGVHKPYYHDKRAEGVEWHEPTNQSLYAELECGLTVPINTWSHRKD